MLELFLLLPMLLQSSSAALPRLNREIKTVTVEVGQTAVLPCTVESLGKYKVVWQDYKQRVLTMDIRRILSDERISVERPYTREWNLHIRKVQLHDTGNYICFINTAPVQERTVQLKVVESPKIIEHLSSPSSVRVREGDTVELVCNATGTPAPQVTWFEKASENNNFVNTPSVAQSAKAACHYSFKEIHNPGEVLVIHNATRQCAKVYLCTAVNGVSPNASRDIRVHVEFAPEVTLPTKKIGQVLSKATILECVIAAYPHNLNRWRHNGKDITRDQEKYTIELYKDSENEVTLSLRIHAITVEDYGHYECFASNLLGKDSETMELYQYRKETTSTTTTTTTLAPWSDTRDDYDQNSGKNGNDGYYDREDYDPNKVKYPDHRNQAGQTWYDNEDNSIRAYDGWKEKRPNGYNREAESNSVRAGPEGERDAGSQVRPQSLLMAILYLLVLYTVS